MQQSPVSHYFNVLVIHWLKTHSEVIPNDFYILIKIYSGCKIIKNIIQINKTRFCESQVSALCPCLH